MWRFRLFCGLVAGGLMLALVGGAHADDKDTSKAGTERKSQNEGEPEVVEISEEGFACNEETISIAYLRAMPWYTLKNNRYELKKGEDSPLLAPRGKTIRWWCNKAFEDWQAPSGTDFIVVTRGPGGAGKVVYYKKK